MTTETARDTTAKGAPARSSGRAAPRPGRDRRAFFAALAFATFIATVWLNQGQSLQAWEADKAENAAHPSLVASIEAPFKFLYRRAPDEELYFATASATLGRPYDKSVFALRGDTPLKAVETPADGRFHVPYREVSFEYPPPNVAFVLLPSLVTTTFAGYSRVFGALMGILLVASALMATRLATTCERERGKRMAAFGLLLLAHGALGIQRLDAIVALLLVLTLRATVHKHSVRFGLFSGLTFATKLVPSAVSLPMVIAGFDLRRARLFRMTLGGLIGLALGLGPMFALSFGSFFQLLRYHGSRGLHVESSLGVIYGSAMAIVGRAQKTVLDYGSYNFHGSVADALAKATPLLLVFLLGLVVRAAYVGRPSEVERDDDARTSRIVLAALATLVALWIGSKVFSPQYLTWALPLVIALPGPSWKRMTLTLGAIVLVSQLYYRGYYDHVYDQLPLGVVTMVVRLGLLGYFFIALLRRLGQRDAPAVSSPP